MKLFKTLFLGVLTVIATSLVADQWSSLQSETERTVIAMDMDDVMSISQKVGFMDFIGTLRIIFYRPGILSTFINIKKIKEDGETVSKEVNGGTNVIYTLLNKLKRTRLCFSWCYKSRLEAAFGIP